MTYDADRRTVLKGIGATGAALAGGAVASRTGAAAIGDSAVLQFYHTNWSDVESQVSANADAGFDAIKIPPAQESKLTRADQDDHRPPLGWVCYAPV